MTSEEILGWVDSFKYPVIIQENKIKVVGWSLSSVDNKVLLEFLVDDIKMGQTKTGINRSDVAKVYPKIKNSIKSGFVFEVPLDELKDGTHKLNVISKTNEQKKSIGTKEFDLLRNYPIPPDEFIKFIGSDNYYRTGNQFLHYFIELGKLQPHENVLDVGCGVGRMAMALTKYLKTGKCECFDVFSDGIKWCKENIEVNNPNFHFNVIDVYHKEYNKNGKQKASEYKFPFPDESFDFVYLTSIFTHLLPKDLENYFSEIVRVMKKNGRCLITYFLLNSESSELMKTKYNKLDIKYKFEGYSSTSETNPERVIGYDEKYIRQLYERNNLSIVEPIHFGNWCGRKEYLNHQDIIIAKKINGKLLINSIFPQISK